MLTKQTETEGEKVINQPQGLAIPHSLLLHSLLKILGTHVHTYTHTHTHTHIHMLSVIYKLAGLKFKP